MAEHMYQADLAIGASGSSSWERCALGLPTISYVIADNQLGIASALESAGAAITIQGVDEFSSKINTAIQNLKNMSIKASLICDGFGAKRVSSSLKV
jgi:spore coat polysaccharide biosynthesis predicted glycosyltransferase SpsG